MSIFLQVARDRNLTKASASLCLTQPAISRQLQALEAEVGVALFDRTGRGMRLTVAGGVFLDYAQRCLALVDDCTQAMTDLRVGAAGQLAIGVGGTHPMYELPEWLRQFADRYPAIDVTIRTGRSQEMVTAVCDRQIDMAFVRIPVDHPGVECITLNEEQISLVGHPAHYPIASVLSPEMARMTPFILFPRGSSFREQINQALSVPGILPRIRMETDSIEEIKRFVSLGFGIAFLPASAVQHEINTGRLISLIIDGLPLLTRATSLIYYKGRYQSIGMREFIAIASHDTGVGHA